MREIFERFTQGRDAVLQIADSTAGNQDGQGKARTEATVRQQCVIKAPVAGICWYTTGRK